MIGWPNKLNFRAQQERNGSNRTAILSVLVDNWFANPRKDRRTVCMGGVGNFMIASVIIEST